MATYKIIRFYAPGENKRSRVVRVNLRLHEAQAHCRSEDTREAGRWFDGYETQTDPDEEVDP